MPHADHPSSQRHPAEHQRRDRQGKARLRGRARRPGSSSTKEKRMIRAMPTTKDGADARTSIEICRAASSRVSCARR